MDFSCGVFETRYETKPRDTREISAIFSSQEESNASKADSEDERTTVTEVDTDSWTISSLSEHPEKEDDGSSLTIVTPLSSYSDDTSYLGSSTLSDISSLLSWADGYLQQFDGYDIEGFYSSGDVVIDLKELSHLIIDGIVGEILSR